MRDYRISYCLYKFIFYSINAANLNEAFTTQQMVGRRDGLGSKYLEQGEIKFLQLIFPQSNGNLEN